MIYLDNGATSFPKPAGMIEAMVKCMALYCGNPGRSGHDMSIRTGEEVFRAREAIAKLFNIDDPTGIIFTGNTTESLNLGIKGVLVRGDHAITTAMEHNSVLRPLKALEREGIEHSIIKCNEDGTLDPGKIKSQIRENTRLIVCTHASNVTGTIMPIAKIGDIVHEYNRGRKKENERPLLFMVDAAQSAGCVPIDVKAMNIDMLALPGHKGLLGPLGTGVLYVKDGISLKHLKEGGTGTSSKERVQPGEIPEGYEAGTINAPGIIGLGFSAVYIGKRGIESIRDYEERRVRDLDEALRNMKNVTVYGTTDSKDKTGIVAFNIEGKSCEEVASLLNDEYGIAVRAGYHCAGLAHKTIGTWDCGAIRASVGPFTRMKEIKTAIDAVYRIGKA